MNLKKCFCFLLTVGISLAARCYGGNLDLPQGIRYSDGLKYGYTGTTPYSFCFVAKVVLDQGKLVFEGDIQGVISLPPEQLKFLSRYNDKMCLVAYSEWYGIAKADEKKEKYTLVISGAPQATIFTDVRNTSTEIARRDFIRKIESEISASLMHLSKNKGNMAVSLEEWARREPLNAERINPIKVSEKMDSIIQAATQGHAEAQYKLGKLYLFGGKGVEPNLEKTAYWYQKAADQNHVAAIEALAQMYIVPDSGVKINAEEHFRLLERAAQLGSFTAQAELAWDYIIGRGCKKNYAKAFELYTSLAESKETSGYIGLGGMYTHGWHVKQDLHNAAECYNKAIANCGGSAIPSHVHAQLGLFYLSGKGVEKDYSKALELLNKAAKEDFSAAYYGLGVIYALGRGVDKDEKMALELLGKALKDKNKAAAALETIIKDNASW